MKTVNKILFIDDDEAANFIHQNIVENEHYADIIITKTSGKEALAYLENSTQDLPDIIFLDLNMPGMDGFEFMKEFEKLIESKEVKDNNHSNLVFVAMLTTSILRENEMKTLDHKYLNMHITKPLTKQHFTEIFDLMKK